MIRNFLKERKGSNRNFLWIILWMKICELERIEIMNKTWKSPHQISSKMLKQCGETFI